MKIIQDAIVSIDYTLRDDDGKILDQSQEGQPLVYMQGWRNIIPGLENAMLEKSEGDTLKVSIAPEDAYGVVIPQMIQEVPKEHFGGVEGEIEVGMQFQARNPEGQVMVVRVVNVEEDTVTIDGNHPLAGKTLHFDVTVRGVREATEEEKAHAEAQMQGGCGCGKGGCDDEKDQCCEDGNCDCKN